MNPKYSYLSYILLTWKILIGYGAGGRLGIGGSDSVCHPTLLESIQHVCIKTVSFLFIIGNIVRPRSVAYLNYYFLFWYLQVAVNSGGKHCLALSADGEVYSWGEGDGKFCQHVRLIVF